MDTAAKPAMQTAGATRGRRWRRALRHVLIGTLVTITLGVSWTWLRWNDRMHGWMVWSGPPAGAWPGPVPDHWPSPAGGNHRYMWLRVGELKYTNSRFKGLSSYSYDVYAYGLPFPALRVDEAVNLKINGFQLGDLSEAAFPWRGYRIKRPFGSRSIIPSPLVVPLLPYWPGFVPNVAFWAWVSALTHRLFAAARTARRQSRGQCPACRYPIGTVPICSECGTAIPGGLCKGVERPGSA